MVKKISLNFCKDFFFKTRGIVEHKFPIRCDGFQYGSCWQDNTNAAMKSVVGWPHFAQRTTVIFSSGKKIRSD